MGKEWLIVAILSAATFAGLSALDPAEDRHRTASEPDGRFAFEGPPRVAAANDTAHVVVLADRPQALDAKWRTPYVAIYESTSSTALCLRFWPCVATHVVAAPGEPRLGMAGFNGTRVTVHVFDAQGDLVFSNGNASEQARLTRTLTPAQLPAGTWYLGANATAPPGTQKPPLAAQAFLPQVRHLIQGLPVGGVATTQTDALATWYGTLFVTLRVDELVHAP